MVLIMIELNAIRKPNPSGYELKYTNHETGQIIVYQWKSNGDSYDDLCILCDYVNAIINMIDLNGEESYMFEV